MNKHCHLHSHVLQRIEVWLIHDLIRAPQIDLPRDIAGNTCPENTDIAGDPDVFKLTASDSRQEVVQFIRRFGPVLGPPCEFSVDIVQADCQGLQGGVLPKIAVLIYSRNQYSIEAELDRGFPVHWAGQTGSSYPVKDAPTATRSLLMLCIACVFSAHRSIVRCSRHAPNPESKIQSMNIVMKFSFAIILRRRRCMSGHD